MLQTHGAGVMPVSVVMPIQRLSLVFRPLHFSRIINPEHELFGGTSRQRRVALARLRPVSTEAISV